MLPSKLKRGPCFGIAVGLTSCFVIVTTVWPTTGSNTPTEMDEDFSLGKPDDYEFNYPHPTETFNEGIPYRHFNTEITYQTDGLPGRTLTQNEDVQLTFAKEAATNYLKHLLPDNTFMNGRYRWLPEGVEYDLFYRDSSMQVTNRVVLFQKLEAPKVIRSIEVNDNTEVNVVITLRGRLDKYAIFLDHLVKNIIPTDPNLTLTVVYFSDSYVHEAKALTRHKLSTVPQFRWFFIPLEDENFSRGRGLHVGSKSKTSESASEILFFCDVDVLMNPDFFNRCRSNTVQGHQVYYPVVFSLYNPRLVYPLFDKDVPAISEQLTISEQSGFWRTFGFGMACMYKSDYEATGGFPDIQTWGREDESLYGKFLQLDNIKVLRAPDPSLFHLYHRKECPDITSISYPACLRSKALTEGSQLQLGLTLLKLHEGIDLEGVLSKRFYYFWLVPYLALLLVLSLLTNIIQASGSVFRRRGHVFRDM